MIEDTELSEISSDKKEEKYVGPPPSAALTSGQVSQRGWLLILYIFFINEMQLN